MRLSFITEAQLPPSESSRKHTRRPCNSKGPSARALSGLQLAGAAEALGGAIQGINDLVTKHGCREYDNRYGDDGHDQAALRQGLPFLILSSSLKPVPAGEALFKSSFSSRGPIVPATAPRHATVWQMP